MAIPIPREPDVDLSSVPRHWIAGNAAATAISNGINMLFPARRAVLRTLGQPLPRPDRATRAARAGEGVLQAGRPARERARRLQRRPARAGLRDRSLPRIATRRSSPWLEDRTARASSTSPAPRPPSTSPRSSPTARSRSGILDDAPSRDAEAARVARRRGDRAQGGRVRRAPASIDDRTRCAIAGLAYATVMLGMFWAWATAMLLRQESIGLRATLRELREDAPRTIRSSAACSCAASGSTCAATFIRATTTNEHLAARVVRGARLSASPRPHEPERSRRRRHRRGQRHRPRHRARLRRARVPASPRAMSIARASTRSQPSSAIARSSSRRSTSPTAPQMAAFADDGPRDRRRPRTSSSTTPASRSAARSSTRRSTTGTGCSASTCAAWSTAATSSCRRWSQRGTGGHVVNISSASSASTPRRTSPRTSRASSPCVGFSQSLRAELAPHQIGVTAICPGMIDTAIVADGRMAGDSQHAQGQDRRHVPARGLRARRRSPPRSSTPCRRTRRSARSGSTRG